ncbi:PAS domain S-box-containing protein [Krasilnikovia cinnamomea]|uniref:histidine kinase n=1 Tax=Krasilnikovia cinnamomea TaxID=349313 RepID=A0A4Q7ZT61_9ACTN|nr:response regulator [Krasilnikovia cinnamomea]RZU54041.1 PAS domain S-box-containing protein [Krasilnikovia cinnamomea]
MTAMAHPRRYALADLALRLGQASADARTVRETVIRAAVDMVGDGAGVALLDNDGCYDAMTVHHPDPARRRLLADALDRRGMPPRDAHSTTMIATRQPIVLSPVTPEQATELAGTRSVHEDGPGVHAAVLCPVVVDDAYAGYLIVARTEPNGRYSAGDVELARDIAGELSLGLSSAQSHERLRAAEERYRRVLETIPEGVLQLDPDGMVTYANEPVGVMLGLPSPQLAGLPMRGFLDDRGQAELAKRLAESRAGRATVGAAQLIRADGSRRRVRVSMVPQPEEPDSTGGSLCIITDTTDQVDARILKRQLDHLRRLDSLGQLIGGISHDFNNLLTVVAGSAEMIASTVEPGSPEHQLASDIVRASATGRSLTHQLLAFGRTAGNRPEVVPVPDLLNEMQALLSRTLGEHITLEISFGPDSRPVRAERGPLEQALVNLAANARDAMPHGGVLRVTASNLELGAGDLAGTPLTGPVVHLAVSDTGVGMSDETRRRAFKPFFTTRPTSAGLGLATTAGIMRSMGGAITLESEPRMGTTVHLYLPAVDETPDRETAAPAVATAVQDVLIVEDQPDVARLVERLLQPAGYSITVSTDTRTAVEAVRNGAKPDLLITDVVMPNMTGPELAEALRAHRPGLPVVYMSGYTAAALGPQIQLDANSVLLEKPFTRSGLLDAIQRLTGTLPPR